MIFFAAILEVYAGDPGAINPIGKIFPLAIGFVLLVFVLVSLPYWIAAFIVAGICKKKCGKWPRFSFWILNILGFIVWCFICISSFRWVLK